MINYQYKIVHQAQLGYEEEMNELGRDGWELVCYWNDRYSFIFKRIID